MENNRCLLYCKDQGYKYAGTEYGDQCYCGDDPYQYGPEDVSNDYVKDYDCNIQCLGDTEQICGGIFRLSVYATGLLSLEQGNTRYVLVSDNTMLSAPATQVLTSKYGIEECAVYCSTFVHCKVFVISMETGHCSLYNSFEVMCEGVQYEQEFKVYFMK
ncbi:unnamed protein product [Mytilus coruscus]|uniref:WSC domain-containing protein n=1 Tax=Mytilus coruscus TaxID=42192 RepID=A0A6J8C9S2_MYTCO|nr:unnamed protein product [Mytilus coruscus]